MPYLQGQFTRPCGEGQDNLSQVQGPALLLHWPARVKNSISCASKGWGQFSMALRFYLSCFLEPPKVGHVSDMNADRSCSWTTDLDMVLGNSMGLDHILALGGSTVLSGQDGSGGSVGPDTTKASGCSPNLGLLCDLSWQHGISAQI